MTSTSTISIEMMAARVGSARGVLANAIALRHEIEMLLKTTRET